MLSNHLILCCPLLLLPSVFPSIRVFSSELALSHQVAKGLELQLQHQSFQLLFRVDFLRIDKLDPLRISKGSSRVFSSTTIQKYQFLRAQPYNTFKYFIGKFLKAHINTFSSFLVLCLKCITFYMKIFSFVHFYCNHSYFLDHYCQLKNQMDENLDYHPTICNFC